MKAIRKFIQTTVDVERALRPLGFSAWKKISFFELSQWDSIKRHLESDPESRSCNLLLGFSKIDVIVSCLHVWGGFMVVEDGLESYKGQSFFVGFMWIKAPKAFLIDPFQVILKVFRQGVVKHGPGIMNRLVNRSTLCHHFFNLHFCFSN